METRWMIHKNKDGTEEKFYPITHSKAIITEDGTTVEEKINNITYETVGAIPEDQLNRKSFNNVDLLETAYTLPRGLYYFRSSCTNLPTSDGSGFHVILLRREKQETTPVIKLIAFDHNSSNVYYNTYNIDTGAWMGWTTHFLPLSGGTLTGPLNISNSTDTTSNTTGALIVSGGAAIGKSLTVSGNILPDVAGGANVGTGTFPFLQTVSRNVYLYNTNNVRTGRLYNSTLGTETDIGVARLNLGNGTSSGTVNNARGILRLYDATKYYAEITTSGGYTANRSFSFPNQGGTFLTSSSGNLNMPITYKTANESYDSFLLRGTASGTSSAPSSMVNGGIYIKY